MNDLPEDGYIVFCGDDREEKGVQVHVLVTRKVFETYETAAEYSKAINKSRNPCIVKIAAIHRLLEGWYPAMPKCKICGEMMGMGPNGISCFVHDTEGR